MTRKTSRNIAAACLAVALYACAMTGTAAHAAALPALVPASAASSARASAVCPAPGPGRAGCLAYELTPPAGSTAAQSLSAHARARARSAAAQAGGQPAGPGAPLAPASETAHSWVEPADLHSAYGLPEDAPAAAGTQTIALVDAYNDLHAEADLRVYDEALHLPPCTTKNGCFKQVNQDG
ncbi:MAG TPA: hypothetical protein VMS02_08250, partial [Solirubrobacteraceae bacterium]|nr:hypothetical protein [Solirubrobacteraceae bacterium]